MPSTDLENAVLFLAPGFIALRVYHAYGFSRQRTDWHWAVWSVIVSLPLDIAGKAILGALPPNQGVVVAVGIRLALALAAGGALAWIWLRIRYSRFPRVVRLAHGFYDSAWDWTLEDAEQYERPIEVELDDGSTYFGWIAEAGREDTGAERWIYITRFLHRRPLAARDEPITGALGVLVDAHTMRRLTVFESADETRDRHFTEGRPDES